MRFIRRILRGIMLALLLLICAALFYLLVIMGDGGSPQHVAEASQGVVSPLPHSPMGFTEETLPEAVSYFGGPVLRLYARGFRLVDGQILDSAYPGVRGNVREIRLLYEGAGGETITLSSLTPAECLRAMPSRGFIVTMTQGIAMAGSQAVLMQQGDTYHLHIRQGAYAYWLEGDVSLDTLKEVAHGADL